MAELGDKQEHKRNQTITDTTSNFEWARGPSIAPAALISPLELREMQLLDKNVVVIDTSELSTYQAGHIPGALCIRDLWSFRSLQEHGGLGEMVAKLKEILKEKGLCGTEKLVFTEEAPFNGFGQSCRALYMAMHLGYPRDNLLILDGGNQRWNSEGLPMNVGDEIPRVVAKNFVTLGEEVSALIEIEEANLALKRGAKFLDVRNEEEIFGICGSPYEVIEGDPPREVIIPCGRIPGALGVVWHDVFEWNSRADSPEFHSKFKSIPELRRLFEDAGLRIDDEIVVYCFKGARASATVHALEMSGYTNVRMYFAGWNEWARDEHTPKETTNIPPERCFGSLKEMLGN